MTDNILIYQNEQGNIKVDVKFEDESIWLTQSQICELYGKAKATISEHIKAIYDEDELQKDSTVRNYRTVQIEGNREVSRDIAKEKSELEYQKYKEQEKEIQKIQSIKELEEDIKYIK